MRLRDREESVCVVIEFLDRHLGVDAKRLLSDPDLRFALSHVLYRVYSDGKEDGMLEAIERFKGPNRENLITMYEAYKGF